MPSANVSNVNGTIALEMPPELRRWNWGAFFLNWIWGLGNRTLLALLMFVPFVNLVMPFVLGAKGNRWAWENGSWRSVEHFRHVQRLWAIWGFVIFGISILFFVGIFALVFVLMGNSEPYKLAVAKLQADPQVVELLGTPIKAGYPMGSIKTQGQSGDAAYDFSATGPKASGHVSLKAVEDFNEWTIASLKLKLDGQNDIVDVVAPSADAVRLANYRLVSPGAEAAKTVFSTDDKKITLKIDYRRPVEGTRVVADWLRNKTDAGGADQELVKDDFTLDANALKNDLMSFSIKADNGLLAGDYHVDISVNGTLAKSIPFKVVDK